MSLRFFLHCLGAIFALHLLCPAIHAAEPAPRDGKYIIQSYGVPGRPPLMLGYVVLERGTYKSLLPGGKSGGEGQYSYEAATHTVKWLTGPFAGQWGGDFTIEREGKTHKIRLKGGTIATNSTDS